MTFIRNIRQKFCKHYFVFDVNKTTAAKLFKKNLVVILVEEEKIQNFKLSETVWKLKQKQKRVLN